MTVRHVIFDLDGTLVDSVAACIEIVEDMLADRGVAQPVCPVTARAYVSLGGAPMISAMMGSACGEVGVELAEFRKRYAVHPTPAESVYPGVVEGLRRLHHQGIGLAICSNKPQNLCEKVIGDIGLTDLFTVVVGGSAHRRPKPAIDLLTDTLDALGSSGDDCLFVGDSELDHATAKAHPMPFLHVSYGYAVEGWLPDSCEQFDRFPDVVSAVLARRIMMAAE